MNNIIKHPILLIVKSAEIKMLKNLKLKIKDFGPIHDADLEISKINIITGKNASGKTTMSKLIYCILTAFSNDGKFLTYKI